MGDSFCFLVLIGLVSCRLCLIQFTSSVTAFSVPSSDINVSTPSHRIYGVVVLDYSDLLLFDHSHAA